MLLRCLEAEMPKVPRFLTAREMELFTLALYYLEKYTEATPDVGMGPSRRTLAHQISDQVSFPVENTDLDELCR